jgi:hypothetical protein
MRRARDVNPTLIFGCLFRFHELHLLKRARKRVRGERRVDKHRERGRDYQGRRGGGRRREKEGEEEEGKEGKEVVMCSKTFGSCSLFFAVMEMTMMISSGVVKALLFISINQSIIR